MPERFPQLSCTFLCLQAHPLPFHPDLSGLGSGAATQLVHITAIFSILLTSDACQQNMHPLMSITRPYSPATMNLIATITLIATTGFYALVSVCSYLVFGPGIEDDILTNLNVDAMAPLVGQSQALVLSYAVRLGYLVSLVGSAVLAM